MCICDVFRLMNLEKMFQFPYEVFFVIWYDSVYHIQYIHLYMSAQYYFIIIFYACDCFAPLRFAWQVKCCRCKCCTEHLLHMTLCSIYCTCIRYAYDNFRSTILLACFCSLLYLFKCESTLSDVILYCHCIYPHGLNSLLEV